MQIIGRVLLAIGVLFAYAEPAAASDSVNITSQGRSRRYLLHVPPGADRTKPMPLVLMFHGGTETPEHAEEMSEFSRLADRDGFIVVYPEAVEKNWADGRGTTAAEQMGVDDVAFTRAVVKDVGKRFAIDPRRVYATGPSNGGVMANRLGCEAADVFAAIGPVIGPIASAVAPKCHPAARLSVIGIQGVVDPLMPFGGGEEGGDAHLGRGGRVEGSRATQELWRTLEKCGAEPATSTLPVKEFDGTSVLRRDYSDCADGTEVVWYEIVGGGHRWPPRQAARPLAEQLARKAFGVSSQNIDASEMIWAFFSAHPKR